MLPTYSLPHHTPPPPRPLTLTVNSKGRVYLSKALLSQLSLRPGQAIDLLPPGAECLYWQLDLRPTASRRLQWYADTRPRFDGVRLPPDLLLPGTSVTLTLASSDATGLGLYSLIPVLTTPDA